MHVCHCFKDFSLAEGGVERYIRYLAEAALKAGHKVTVIVSRPSGSSRTDIIDGIEEIRTRPFFYMFKVPIMPGYYNCLKSLKPDLIHAHGTIPNVSDMAVIYAARNHIPCILDYQFDGNAESFLGMLFAGIYNHTINRIAAAMATKITATSLSYAESSPVLRHFLDKVEIVPNGVDLTRFNAQVEETSIREKYNLPKTNIIFFAGRFVKYKGIKYLIQAMKYVTDGVLVIAGKGPEEKAIRQLAEKLKLNNIIFPGLIRHEDLPELYRISDVYVLPSITRGENFGIAALEAMACGTPVVASDLPGIRALVTDEVGIKVKPKDVQGLAYAINTLLADNGLRLKMGQAARENAEKCNWDAISSRILEIYDGLVK